MTATIDLGQVIIAGLLALLSIIGWYIKRDLTNFGQRLDKHDEALFQLTGSIQRIIGYVQGVASVSQEDTPFPKSRRKD